MIERLIRWGVPRYLGGPSRNWVFTSLALAGYRLARRGTGRRQIIDVGPVGTGKKIVIEHVPESHAQQIKGEKRAAKAAKRERRAAKKVRRGERRDERQTARADRKVRRHERKDRRRRRRAERAERRAAKAAAAGTTD
ncbi:MAG: hypothetical protein AAF962_04190 [Actinomycetota bacterium]